MYQAKKRSAENDALIADYENQIAAARKEIAGLELGDLRIGELEQQITDLTREQGLCIEAQRGLNQAVAEAEGPVEEAREAYEFYGDEQERIEGELKDSTEAQEDNEDAAKGSAKAMENFAEATEDASDAADEAADAVKELTAKEKLQNLAAKAVAIVEKSAVASLGKAAKAAKEAGKAYDQSAKDMSTSIQKQVGLFDKFEARADVNIETLKQNAASRRQAISDYAENLDKLIQWAEQSGSQAAKDYVAAIAEMGMGAAEEVAVLANSANEDLTWLAEQNYEATVSANFAGERAAYAMNDFMTVQQVKFAAFAYNISNSINTKLSDNKIWNTFKANSKAALDGQKTYWSSNSPTTKVTVNTPTAKELFGKGQTIQKGIGTPKTNVSVGIPGNDTLQELRRQVVKPFQGLTAKVAVSVTGAAQAGRDAASTIKRNAGTVYVPVAAKYQNAARPYAAGGIVDTPTYSLVGEAGPEAIIPLSSVMRSRALDLYEETGEILGMSSKTPGTASVSLPDREDKTLSILSKQKDIDFDKLYEVVALAARYGIMSANIKLVAKDREVARSLKDMGVMFA